MGSLRGMIHTCVAAMAVSGNGNFILGAGRAIKCDLGDVEMRFGRGGSCVTESRDESKSGGDGKYLHFADWERILNR